MSASFDLLGDFTMEDFSDLMVPEPTSCASRKRERDSFDFLFQDDAALDTKKPKLEDAVTRLLGVHLEDDDFTAKFRDCPHFAGNDDADFDVDALLFDAEGEKAADFSMTPPRGMARSASATTPPMSPRAEEEPLALLLCPQSTNEESSALLPPPQNLDQPCSPSVLLMLSRAASGMAVLSNNLLDLDTVTDRMDEKRLRAAPACLARSFSVDVNSRMPLATWFVAQPPAFVSFPVGASGGAVAVKTVYVEECSLSAEQKAKHALWFTKRKRCLTGHTGYKCPAKSRAAKKKVRANGRFNHKK